VSVLHPKGGDTKPAHARGGSAQLQVSACARRSRAAATGCRCVNPECGIRGAQLCNARVVGLICDPRTANPHPTLRRCPPLLPPPPLHACIPNHPRALCPRQHKLSVLKSGVPEDEMKAAIGFGELEEVHAVVRGELELIKNLGIPVFVCGRACVHRGAGGSVLCWLCRGVGTRMCWDTGCVS
jgi:hypothetical protein